MSDIRAMAKASKQQRERRYESLKSIGVLQELMHMTGAQPDERIKQ